jgi:D-alanyl-D-alanine carboxypeptidase/D-alanyl-D-alanine-endopeptidase (penicillin-binding protein 4)
LANRLRVTALITLAMLNVFTVGAGVAVAGLMPARLALWNIPRVAAVPAAGARPVLPAAAGSGLPPTRGGLAATLNPLLNRGVLGMHVGVVVSDMSSGRVLFSNGASTPLEPASTAKLTTAVAALDVLGPSATFSTRVTGGASPGSIVLVGGGDPTLAAGPPPASDYPRPATLKSLAAATARALRADGRRSVRLSYDTSLFTGRALAPGWTTSYVTTGNVTPITSLEVDQGRLTASGAPQDADNPDNFRPRSLTPAPQAARVFASFLARQGIHVAGGITQQRAPGHAAAIASVSSPPLSAIVGQMLRESNNVIAEDLARQVAVHKGAPASFSGAAASVTKVLRGLGVSGGIHLVDGSGLSPEDRVAPAALAQVLAVAAASSHPGLRATLTGMPVAGFSGTLAPGQSVFGRFTGPGVGLVRAKTGNLNTVVDMAGTAYDTNGRVLVFAFMADRVPARRLLQAASTIDAMAGALARCGCR